jgi:hypothetical protein
VKFTPTSGIQINEAKKKKKAHIGGILLSSTDDAKMYKE